MRILVQHVHPRVGWSIIEVVVKFFYILAMVSLRVGYAKETLFNNGVVRVPQRYGKAQALLIIADAANPIFAPAVGFAAGHIVGDVVPRIAIGAVVFAHGAPLSVAQIGPPKAPPGLPRQARSTFVQQSLLFGPHCKVKERQKCGYILCVFSV